MYTPDKTTEHLANEQSNVFLEFIKTLILVGMNDKKVIETLYSSLSVKVVEIRESDYYQKLINDPSTNALLNEITSIREIVNQEQVPQVLMGDDENKEFEITKGTDMAKMPTKQKPFIVDTMIPEQAMTAITAASGKGKSIVSLIIAEAIATGKPFLGEFKTKKRKILIIDQEMDKDIILGRYQAIIKNSKNIDYMFEQMWTIDTLNNLEWLKQKIKNENYKVLILDTLTMIHSKDENSANEMKEVNKLLLKLIKETGVSIIYLHHHRKGQRGEGLSQISSRGSTEIIAKVASHLLVDSKRGLSVKNGNFDKNLIVNHITIQQEKSRRPESIAMIGLTTTYNMETKKTTWEYAGEINKDAKEIEKAEQKIIKLIKEKGEKWTINKLTDELENTSKPNIRKACHKLKDANTLDSHKGTGKHWNTDYYFLKNSKITA